MEFDEFLIEEYGIENGVYRDDSGRVIGEIDDRGTFNPQPTTEIVHKANFHEKSIPETIQDNSDYERAEVRDGNTLLGYFSRDGNFTRLGVRGDDVVKYQMAQGQTIGFQRGLVNRVTPSRSRGSRLADILRE